MGGLERLREGGFILYRNMNDSVRVGTMVLVEGMGKGKIEIGDVLRIYHKGAQEPEVGRGGELAVGGLRDKGIEVYVGREEIGKYLEGQGYGQGEIERWYSLLEERRGRHGISGRAFRGPQEEGLV